jgi:O-antigen/teichoic acid export membrane protein
MSLNRVLRGSFWLYISGISSNFIGYIYWFFASQFVEPTTIGDAAVILGIASMVSGVFSFGISSGATRMFGRANGQNDRKSLSSYFSSVLTANFLIQIVVAILAYLIGTFSPIMRFETIYIALLIAVGGWPGILSSLFSATLRTSAIALASIVSTLIRLVLGIALLYIGTGFLGIMLAYIIMDVVYDAILLYQSSRLVSFERPSITPVKEALTTGIPNWLPGLISTAGTWLGILGIYSFSGSQQTGIYYIAFNISSIICAIPLSLLGLMFPVLSGMEDGRKRATNRAIRLSFAITVPLAALGIAYPYVPLSLLGSSYVTASLALQILLIGCLIAPMTSGFNSLVYAYGKYRYVTLLGLSLNIPRVVLYPFLVAMWGENGAAVAYVSGYFFALAAVVVMARRINYSIGWRPSLALTLIPLAITSIVYLGNLYWVFGTLIILGVTAVTYARLGLITRADLAEISSAFVSRERLDRMYPYVRYLLRVLYGE